MIVDPCIGRHAWHKRRHQFPDRRDDRQSSIVFRIIGAETQGREIERNDAGTERRKEDKKANFESVFYSSRRCVLAPWRSANGTAYWAAASNSHFQNPRPVALRATVCDEAVVTFSLRQHQSRHESQNCVCDFERAQAVYVFDRPWNGRPTHSGSAFLRSRDAPLNGPNP